MKVVYKNNVSGELAVEAEAADTTITLVSGTGWPSPAAGFPDYEQSWATLETDEQDPADRTREIVLITGRSGAVLTVQRGQQGTTALDWPVGTTIEHRWTAEDGASRIWHYYAPSLAVDGDLAVDSASEVIWYRTAGATHRLLRAVPAGTAIAGGLVVHAGSNGGIAEAQTAWQVTGNARLGPTSSACLFQIPTLPAPEPPGLVAGYLWIDTATDELVVDNGTTLLRFGAGSGTPGALAVLAVTRSGAGGAGATTSTTALAGGGRVYRVRAVVETAFDAGATAKVGWSDDDDALLTVADLPAGVLATLGAEIEFTCDTAATGTRQLVVTTTGSSTVGSLRVTVHHAVPEA